MKKSLLILLALLLMASMLLTACDLGGDPVPTETTEAPSDDDDNGDGNGGNGGKKPSDTPDIPADPPKGYLFYTSNTLRFAYPKDWTCERVNNSTVVFYDEKSSDNLTICSDDVAKQYEALTLENLASRLPSVPEAQSITTKDNIFGLTVKIIAYTMTVEGTTITQHIFYTQLNGESYALILSDYTGTLGDMADVIFDSMVDLSAADDSISDSATSFKTFSNYNFRFAYPGSWTTDDVAPTRSATFEGEGYNLVLQSGPATTMFSDLTNQSFEEEMVPNLEQSMSAEISDWYVEHGKNDNGLNVTIVTYTVATKEMTAHQVWFATTIDESTHWMMLTITLEEEDEELLLTILNSMVAIDGTNVNGSTSNSGSSGGGYSDNTTTTPVKPNPGHNNESTDPGATTKPENPNPGHNNNDNSSMTDPSVPPVMNDENASDDSLNRELYNEAIHLLEKGEYDKAYYIFQEIHDYADVSSYLKYFSESGGKIVYNGPVHSYSSSPVFYL